ncbi:MAG TPA: hypothetical protein VF378_06125, partial [Geothrix sp.]
YMRDMGYPELSTHMALHADLLGKAHDLQAKLQKGTPITMDVTIFMANWLKHHINGDDMGYVAFVKEKNRK